MKRIERFPERHNILTVLRSKSMQIMTKGEFKQLHKMYHTSQTQ